jgi:hypothetical protein
MDHSLSPQADDMRPQALGAIRPTDILRQSQDLTFANEKANYSDVDEKNSPDIEVASASYSDELDPLKVVIPDEDDEFIDPRLKNYPVPLVAKTVDLHNDDK